MKRAPFTIPPPTTIAIVALALWGVYGLLALTGLAPAPHLGRTSYPIPPHEETLPATITRETQCEPHRVTAYTPNTLTPELCAADALPSSDTASDTPLPTPLVAADLYEAINRERTATGLPALTTHPLLEVSACTKADDMVVKNYWSHTAPDGTNPWQVIERAGYLYQMAGENLAQGHQTAQAAVDAWMKSPGHRENIVGNYSEMGMCVRSSVQYQGRVTNLIVNHFGTRR